MVRTFLAVLIGFVTFGLVAVPVRAQDDTQRGFIFWEHPPNYGSLAAAAALDQLATAGADTVVLVVPWYTKDSHSADLAPGPFTPNDVDLAYTIYKSQQYGKRVVLFLRVDTLDGSWRGFLDPWDKDTFFSEYSRFVNRYAELAEAQGVQGLVVGSETVELTRPAATWRWQAVIRDVRARFSGFLTYSAQWGSGGPTSQGEPVEEYRQIGFWPDLDYIGISAYFNLADSPWPPPTLQQLVVRWDAWRLREIDPFQAQYGKPVIFTEVGYKSTGQAATRPWDGALSEGVDLAQQALLYQALFEAWQDVPWFAGVYLWHWSTNPGANESFSSDYPPQRKPAESIIRQWFGR